MGVPSATTARGGMRRKELVAVRVLGRVAVGDASWLSDGVDVSDGVDDGDAAIDSDTLGSSDGDEDGSESEADAVGSDEGDDDGDGVSAKVSDSEEVSVFRFVRDFPRVNVGVRTYVSVCSPVSESLATGLRDADFDRVGRFVVLTVTRSELVSVPDSANESVSDALPVDDLVKVTQVSPLNPGRQPLQSADGSRPLSHALHVRPPY